MYNFKPLSFSKKIILSYKKATIGRNFFEIHIEKKSKTKYKSQVELDLLLKTVAKYYHSFSYYFLSKNVFFSTTYTWKHQS